MRLKRPLYGPQDTRGPSRGRDVRDFVKRSLQRVELDFFPRPPAGFDDVYNMKVVRAMRILQDANGIQATGNMGAETFDLLWREYADAYAKWAYVKWSYVPAKPKPELVRCFPIAARYPVRNFGGVSAHMSRALGNWQSDRAIDIGAPERSQVLAIAPGKVVKISGFDPDGGPRGTIFGQSITVELTDGRQVFYTHQKMHPQTDLGERVVAGEMLSYVADYGPVGRWPEHLHIAWSRGNPEEMWDPKRWPRVPAGDPD